MLDVWAMPWAILLVRAGKTLKDTEAGPSTSTVQQRTGENTGGGLMAVGLTCTSQILHVLENGMFMSTEV